MVGFGHIGAAIVGGIMLFNGSAAWLPTQANCIGDCDRSGGVAVNEIVTGVNIALGAADLSRCPDIDADLDRGVSVEEIVLAVEDALGGCR